MLIFLVLILSSLCERNVGVVEETVDSYLTALREGNFSRVQELLSPNFNLTFPGEGILPMAGTYTNLFDFFNVVSKYFKDYKFVSFDIVSCDEELNFRCEAHVMEIEVCIKTEKVNHLFNHVTYTVDPERQQINRVDIMVDTAKIWASMCSGEMKCNIS